MSAARVLQDILDTLKQRKITGQLAKEWEGMLANNELRPLFLEIAKDEKLFGDFITELYAIFEADVDPDHLRYIHQLPKQAQQLNASYHKGLPLGMAADVMLIMLNQVKEV